MIADKFSAVLEWFSVVFKSSSCLIAFFSAFSQIFEMFKPSSFAFKTSFALMYIVTFFFPLDPRGICNPPQIQFSLLVYVNGKNFSV